MSVVGVRFLLCLPCSRKLVKKVFENLKNFFQKVFKRVLRAEPWVRPLTAFLFCELFSLRPRCQRKKRGKVYRKHRSSRCNYKLFCIGRGELRSPAGDHRSPLRVCIVEWGFIQTHRGSHRSSARNRKSFATELLRTSFSTIHNPKNSPKKEKYRKIIEFFIKISSILRKRCYTVRFITHIVCYN